MRGGRLLQPLMVTRGIKELLLWMTLGANEYEYIYKNRHGLPSQCRLGVTVTLAGHGWWEREPLPLEMEDVSGIRQTTDTHTHTHTLIHTHNRKSSSIMTFNKAPFKVWQSCHLMILFTQWTETVWCIKACVYLPEIIIIPVSIMANCSIRAWCHGK